MYARNKAYNNGHMYIQISACACVCVIIVIDIDMNEIQTVKLIDVHK